MLFARALFAFLVLPGMVAFVVPLLLAQPQPLNPIGLVPLAIGVAGYSRNTMYVSVALILWGWAVGFESRTLAVYAVTVMVAFHIRVVSGEEPWLARMHGDTWTRYRAEVPRWIGKRRRT